MKCEFLGYIGGFFYAICYFPQLYSMWKGKNFDINIYYIISQIIGSSSMIAYASLNNIYPVLWLNFFSCVCLLIIIWFFKKK